MQGRDHSSRAGSSQVVTGLHWVTQTELGGRQGLCSQESHTGNPGPLKTGQRPAGHQVLGATLSPARRFHGDRKFVQGSFTCPRREPGTDKSVNIRQPS